MSRVLSDTISNALPQGPGFLRSYVEYASACSDAPPVYHVGVGLTVFSAAVAKRLACPWMAGRTLIPNLYTLLVGPSRSARKTGSMDAGIDILANADQSLVMPVPGSYEELVAQIRRKPDGMLTYREFGHFLKTTQRGYTEAIRTLLMDLYDWPPDRPYTRNLKKGATIIEPPICLSMLASIATDLLFAYTDLEEWTGGFFGRMVVLYAERSEFRMPTTWQTARMQLADYLQKFSIWDIPPCGGFSPDAWDYFGKWSKWRDSQSINVPSRVQSFISGATTLAAKISLLYATDRGEPMAGAGWMVSTESIYRAIQFVDNLYLPSVQHLGERLAIGLWERDRQRVLDTIEAQYLGITRKDLIRRVKMQSDYIDTVIATLKEEGAITQHNGAQGTVYRRVGVQGAAPGGAPVRTMQPAAPAAETVER